MRRPGICPLDPIQLNSLDGRGDARVLLLEPREFLPLLRHNFIELLAQAFEMRDVRFEARESVGGLLSHAAKLATAARAPTKFCLRRLAPPEDSDPCAVARSSSFPLA